MKLKSLILTAIAAVALRAGGETPIKDVIAQIDPATGKAKDTTTAFAISGIVSARAVVDGDKVIAFVQPTGAAGVAVLATKQDAALLVPRNEIKLTGNFGDSPLGIAALQVKAGSVSLVATNKAFGASEPRGADFFKDASSLTGRYVQITNVTFVGTKFDGSGNARVKGDGGEVLLLVSKTLKDRDVPNAPANVFGVPVKLKDGWALLASRFLPVSGKNAQVLAAKHTCLACHNPDVKAVGPAYRDVAAKYKDDHEMAAKLMEQMDKGGVGKWGQVPMPPLGTKVPPEDRKVLAEWIAGYRWDAVLAE